jgi:4'-phosphopantetheinyl transferase
MLDVVILTVIPELGQDKFDMLLPFVSAEKQDRIKKFHFFRDARNCLLGDVLSRIELCRAAGSSNNQLEISLNPYGKPFLKNNPHMHFNISHNNHYIACVVSDKPVGIDIELIKPVDVTIARRFFTPDETAYIMNGERELRFYEIWTKKESHIKWDGRGLHKPLTSFSVINPNERELTFYHKIFESADAVGHVCSINMTSPSIRIIDISSFLYEVDFFKHSMIK